jgi:hypothetical protein
MFAVIAAVLFAIVLVLDLANKDLGPVLTNTFLTTAGLLCIALHLAGAGGWSRYRRSSRGRG